MGFLKFLKRDKKKDTLEDLDLPPEPPPLEDFEKELPELPEFPEFGEEKISAPKEEELPSFDFPEKEEKLPEFPSFPELEEEPITPIPPLSTPSQVPEPIPAPQLAPEPEPSQEELPSSAQLDIYPKIKTRLFEHGKITRERPKEKTIYVRVDSFKAMLGTINIAKSDLRKSEESLIKLENIKNSKDKSFNKMRLLLDDLQKKLIYVDKTLFKGE